MPKSRISLIGTTVALSLAAISSATAAPRSYIISATGNALPSQLASQVAAAGGTLQRVMPNIGMAVASSNSPGFSAAASKISGIRSVVPNIRVQWLNPSEQVELAADFGNPPNSGDNDTRFDLQWGHDAVDAPEAWTAGYFGAGVRVAVLDSGVDATHPDLAPNVNTTLSKSFVPGENWQVQPGFYFNHGTHVAGTIAAADNGIGIIGIAPQAEIVAVKVLSEYTGSGDFYWIVEGIVYAADIGADVINMSLGATFPRHGWIDDNGTPADPTDDFKVGANEVSELVTAVGRAVTYAYQHGTTVIASAGNDGIDKNHSADIVSVPGDVQNVITVAATAPVGWGVDKTVSLDNPASYTNFGTSEIDVSAPGGDFMYYFVNPTQQCTVAGLTRPCYVFDYVLSDIPGGYSWAAGTSMAAPHVSGVAALIIGKNGGSMRPAQVEAALKKSADDLGKPGKDPFYGAGRVNAANAVN
jgi:subtilisin family serine protease